MPRILIADDNSNIQRMATLALKDAGIEVIAVGNGEAAVRKIPEILPDLVLADIFMPVRNGYEVCEFVKRDSRYANIPVLLLAGAFDPFDEQEAQRVHADGVLKKPFVPPDPLINAVKTLLAKSVGDRLIAVTVPVAAETSAESGGTAVAEPRVLETPAEARSYEPPEEFALPLNRDDLGAHEKAVAFAPSPEASVPETDEAESVVTASRDPSLGEPAFWVPTEEPGEAEEAEEAPGQDLTDHTWYNEGRAIPLRDDPAPLEGLAPAAGLQHDDLATAETVPQDLVQDLLPPAVTAAPTVPTSDSASPKARSAEDTLPLPETWVESAALEMESLEGSSFSESTASPLSAALPTALAPSLAPPSPTPSLGELPPIPVAPLGATSESERAPDEDEIPMMEFAKSFPEWTQPPRAFQKPEPGSAPKEQVAKPEAEAEPQEQVAEPEPSARQEPEAESESEFAIEWPPAFIPAISSGINEARTAALQIVSAARSAPEVSESAAVPGQPNLVLPNPGAASLSPEAVEAAIQRVMERMQPQIIELVTRDILRPLVEALVRQELKK